MMDDCSPSALNAQIIQTQPGWISTEQPSEMLENHKNNEKELPEMRSAAFSAWRQRFAGRLRTQILFSVSPVS